MPRPAAPLGSFPWPPETAARWWALGVHGGAGATSLVRALEAGGADADGRWPDVSGAQHGGVPVLLVARTDARGLEAAQAAVQEWTSGAAPASTALVGLALMADAPARPPRPLRDRMRLLSGAVPRLWEVPWIAEWRLGAQPRRPVRELEPIAAAVRQSEPPAAAPHHSTPEPTAPQPSRRTAEGIR